MKLFKKIKSKKLLLILSILPLLVLTQCVFLESIDQPDTAVAGEDFVVTLHTRYHPNEAGQNVRMVLAILVPKNWNAGNNASISYTCLNTAFASGNFYKIPDDEIKNDVTWPALMKNKFGVGDNYLSDSLEWVCFWSEHQYDFINNEESYVDIVIRTKVGNRNVQFKPGYVICSTCDVLSDYWGTETVYKKKFMDCLTVSGGKGELLDCCNPPISSITPGYAKDNDLITVLYDKDAIATLLDSFPEKYLLVRGVKSNSELIDAPSDKLLMTKVGVTGNKYDVTFWPRGYFKIADDETLEGLQYYITNKSGDVKIGYANSSVPFTYSLKCE